MKPIRVALIGLSSSAKTSWAAQAHLPYLLSSRGRLHYEVVALLNSSSQAAEAARAHFNLPSSVKAYGDPKDLASDPDVDLVVCNTRVDNHAPTTEPSIRAGKAVYIEWPISGDFKSAIALTGGKQYENSVAGLQGRVSPVTLKLKEVLASGAIGRVLSSDIRAFGSLLPRDKLPGGLKYFADRKIGGNPITIEYAHMIDYVLDVLGEFESFESRMQIQRPQVAIVDSLKDGAQIKEVVESNVPDFLAVHGGLTGEKEYVVKHATLVAIFRSGPPFKGQPAFVWTINGEKGELTVTSPAGPYLHSDSYGEPINIELHDHATDEVVQVPWHWEGWQKELPLRARVVAELYERYARWQEAGAKASSASEGENWPRIHDAVARLKDFETLFQQYDEQQKI